MQQLNEALINNKVANSGLVTIDLERFYPKEELVTFDLKGFLYLELIIKEKDFREALKQTDWQQYKNKIVCIVCTADAIIPMWAYMLIASYLQPVAKQIFTTNITEAITQIILAHINNIDKTEYTDKRIVIKGCGEKEIAPAAYQAITAHLLPVAKSIMYGEPCSTVPIFKAK